MTGSDDVVGVLKQHEQEIAILKERQTGLQKQLDLLGSRPGRPASAAAGPAPRAPPKRVAFLTAGGLAPCLSSSIGALIERYTELYPSVSIIAYVGGYKGLLLGDKITVNKDVRRNAGILHKFGGSPIGNSRVKLTNIKDCVKRGLVKEGQNPQDVAAKQLVADGIEVLHTIGGDDTNTAAADLAAYLEENGYNLTVIGLPKTIDNDVFPIKQTLGAYSAAEEGAKFFMNVVGEHSANPRMLIVHEVMGRACGYLTAATARAYRELLNTKTFLPAAGLTKEAMDVHAVFVPELHIDIDAEAFRLKKIMDHHGCVNIFISEGAGVEDIVKEMESRGQDIPRDAFGHVKLDKVNPGEWFAKQFAHMIGAQKTLSQKSGYFSRAAPANQEDLRLIQACASLAVDCAVRGESGVIGHDEDNGDLLRAIEFPRIKGGKPFNTNAPWFLQMMTEIHNSGQDYKLKSMGSRIMTPSEKATVPKKEGVKRIGILTAGGLAPCLSSAMAALIERYTELYPENEIICYRGGYKGLLLGDSFTLDAETRAKIGILHEFGGSPIGNSRVKLSNVKDCFARGLIPTADSDPRGVAAEQLVKDGINILHTIGGDDTNTAAADLAAFLATNNYNLTVVGLPKTVDNDVYPIKQSLGAWSAAEAGAKFFMNVVGEHSCNPRMLIIHEVMGRDCGYLTAATARRYHDMLKQRTFVPAIGLCQEAMDVHAIFVPELPIDINGEAVRLMKIMDRLGCVNIFISEGAGVQDIIKEMEERGEEVPRDAFGHVKLDKVNPGEWFGKQFAAMIKAEKTLVQKSGYFSRAAPANREDLRLIQACCSLAVDCAMRGEEGVIGHDENNGNRLRACEFPRIKGHKPFNHDQEWFIELLANIGQTGHLPTRQKVEPGNVADVNMVVATHVYDEKAMVE